MNTQIKRPKPKFTLEFKQDAVKLVKESINLAKLAKAFPGKAKADSSYRRMQRFINEAHAIEFDSVAWFVMKLFGFLDTDYCLTFDRTNWQCTHRHKGPERH